MFLVILLTYYLQYCLVTLASGIPGCHFVKFVISFLNVNYE